MKAVWFFPAGIVVGALLTWGVLSGSMRVPPGRRQAAEPDHVGVGTAAPAPPEVEEVPDLTRSDPGPAAELELTDQKKILYWLSKATAHGLAQKRTEFLADLESALSAGATAKNLTETIAHLEPEKDRAGVLEELMRRHPDVEWNTWTLASLYQLAGEKQAAFDTLAEKLADPPDNPTNLITRLIALDPERAASLLLEASEREGWSGAILLHIGRELMGQGRNRLGMPFVLAALDATPGNEDAIRLLGTMDPVAALGRAQRAIEADPSDADAWALLAKLRLDAGDKAGSFEAYANAARNEGDTDTRRGYLSGMLASDPERALPIIQELLQSGDDEDLGLLGRALVANHQRSKAFDIFVRAHGDDTTDSEWLHRMVSADRALAIRHFADELEQNPTTSNDELVGVYASALLRAGRADEAYEQFLRAWKIDQGDWEWMQGVAASNPSKAARLLEDKRRDEPDDGTIAGALADAYSRMGRTAEAIRLYEFAIDKGDGRHRWMSGLAAIDPGRGLPMIRKEIEESPEDDDLWGALGLAYSRMGKVEEARKAFDRALTIDNSDWEWAYYRSALD